MILVLVVVHRTHIKLVVNLLIKFIFKQNRHINLYYLEAPCNFTLMIRHENQALELIRAYKITRQTPFFKDLTFTTHCNVLESCCDHDSMIKPGGALSSNFWGWRNANSSFNPTNSMKIGLSCKQQQTHMYSRC